MKYSLEKINDAKSYLWYEEGDKKTLIAITDSTEKAHFLATAANQYKEPESPVEAAAKDAEQILDDAHWKFVTEQGLSSIHTRTFPEAYRQQALIAMKEYAKSNPGEQGQEEWETAYDSYVRDTWDEEDKPDSSLNFLSYLESHYHLIKK